VTLPPALFVLTWLGALGWNAYWWLFRFAIALSLESGVVRWRSVLRSGDLPVGALTAIRPGRLSRRTVIVEHTMGRPVVVFSGMGRKLGPFLAELATARPDLPIHLSRFTQRHGT